MKKLILLLLFIPLVSFGQWTLDESNDPFDGKISTIEHRGYGGEFPYENPVLIIRYKHLKEELDIYITDMGYSGCSDNIIYASFNNTPENVFKYWVTASTDNKAVFFRDYQFSTLLSNLKTFSTVTIKFSNSCGDKRFKFNLLGSSKAINNLLEKTTNYNKKAIQLKKSKLKTKNSYVEKLINQAKEIADWEVNELNSLKYQIEKDYDDEVKYDSLIVKPRSFKDYLIDENWVKALYIDNFEKTTLIGNYSATIKDKYLEKKFIDLKKSISKLHQKAEKVKLSSFGLFKSLLSDKIKFEYGEIYKDVRFEPVLKPFDFFEEYGRVNTYLINENNEEILLSSSLQVEKNSPLYDDYEKSIDLKAERLKIEKSRVAELLKRLKRKDVIDYVVDNIYKNTSKSIYTEENFKLSDINKVSVEFFYKYGNRVLDARLKIFLNDGNFVLIKNLYLSMLENEIDKKYLREIGAKVNEPF
jgi:hypothetical protein